MERLTKGERNERGTGISKQSLIDREGTPILSDYAVKILTRLAEYEDLDRTPKELKSILQDIADGKLISVVESSWERIVNPYGELEGFICECGHQSICAHSYCPRCGAKMGIPREEKE